MKKKHLFIIAVIAVLLFLSVPVIHILKTKWNESDNKNAITKGFTNDASQLNLTETDTLIIVPNNKSDIEKQL